MDFSWSEEQLAIKAQAIEFARENLNEDVLEHDREGAFRREAWRRCAEFGLLGMSLPADYNGGKDTDFMTAMLVMEGIGYGCADNGLTFALNAQMWTVQLPILRFGNKEQKSRYLPDMSRGALIGAHALTEPKAGSDAFSMSTVAVKTEGGYLLNGAKHLVSLAPVADVLLVFAASDPEKGKWGISAFLIDRDTPGLSFGPVREKMGLRTVPMGNLYLEDCFVPEANLLGREGAGVGISNSSLEWERCCILASQLGAMQRQLEKSIEFVRGRKQFGKPISKFQSVSNRIVDMRLRLETARLLLYKAAWLKMTDQPATTEVALLKLHLAESFVESSIDAIKLHGGIGYLTEFEVERDLRDAVGGTIYAGTSDIQRNIIAAMMGL